MEYHYVYLIEEIDTSKKYIGVRTCENRLPVDDIGHHYFSSSTNNEFIANQRKNPLNYRYIVLEELLTRKEAMIYENRIHHEKDVGGNNSYYNRINAPINGFNSKGLVWSDESRKKRCGEGNPMYGKHSAKYNTGYKIEYENKEYTAKVLAVKLGYSAITIRKWACENKNGLTKLEKSGFEDRKGFKHTSEAKEKIASSSLKMHSDRDDKTKKIIHEKISKAQLGVAKPRFQKKKILSF